jgi:hypothetical protein
MRQHSLVATAENIWVQNTIWHTLMTLQDENPFEMKFENKTDNQLWFKKMHFAKFKYAQGKNPTRNRGPIGFPDWGKEFSWSMSPWEQIRCKDWWNLHETMRPSLVNMH